MIEQTSSDQHRHQHGVHAMKRKEIVEDPEEVEERNELIEKRCCICLEEMRDKVRPEECRHVFCRTCILGWTNTFSNLCPLCKVEIHWLLIYKEIDLDSNEETKDEVVDRLQVVKPKVNDEISDYIASFAENCYVCQ
jgi:Ring finger domain